MAVHDESSSYIRLIGGLEIACNGELLSDPHRRGRKANTALSYLLLKRGQPVPAYELARVSGVNSKGRNAAGALKVLIFRLRRRLSDEGLEGLDCIHSTMRGYAWNMASGVRVDLFEAELLCESAISAKRLSSLSAPQIADLTDLSGRELLPEMRGEAWADAAERRFRNLHASAMSHALELMWKAGDVQRVIRTCHRGLANDAANELLFHHLRRATAAADRNPARESMPWGERRKHHCGRP